MAENAANSLRQVASAQSYIKEKYSDTIGLATSILGQVLLGTIKGTKRSKDVIKLCLKDMKHQFSDRVAEDPRTEISFMKTICNRSHPHFVRFIDAVEDHKLYCMCIEYVAGGDMCTYIQNLRSGIHVTRAKKYAIQLTKAVYFMHCNGFCHLDLSLENVLWDKKNDTLKICDFGLSRRLPQNDINKMFAAATVRPGKKGYMAPEIYAYQRFNGEKADVFSLGVIIFILLTGFPPFTTPNASDKCFQYMYYGKLEWLLKQWKLNDIIDADCRALLSKIFCHPKKRMGIKQMLESLWLDQNIEDIDAEMAAYTVIDDTSIDNTAIDSTSIDNNNTLITEAMTQLTLNESSNDKKEESPPSIIRNQTMTRNKKRKSVPRLVKKKRLSKGKKLKKLLSTQLQQSQSQQKKVSTTIISKEKIKQRERELKRGKYKSKSIAHINLAHVLLNESSTALLAEHAATVKTVTVTGCNGDAACKSRRNRSKSVSYSHQHHHSSSYSLFINDFRLMKKKKTKTTNNVQQIRRDSACSASSTMGSNSGRDSEETITLAKYDDHKQKKTSRKNRRYDDARGGSYKNNDTANLRESKRSNSSADASEIMLNHTQLITQHNDNYDNDDRKEGDDETYPYHEHQVHERHSVTSQTTAQDSPVPHEERLSITSQDAGSVHQDSPQTKAISDPHEANNNNSKSNQKEI